MCIYGGAQFVKSELWVNPRRDFEAANGLLASIPTAEHNQIARFLESQVRHKFSTVLWRGDIVYSGKCRFK